MVFNTQSIILASSSTTRCEILKSAHLAFEAHQPRVDEAALHIVSPLISAADLAIKLAKSKAMSLSGVFPNHLILGADQTLEFEGRVHHKANTVQEAKTALRLMSGKIHHLHSAFSVVQNGNELSNHLSTATLRMRTLSDSFIEIYAENQQEALLNSVGGYYYEGMGVHLFEKVAGDIHTILGLPLLPLLAFLRQQAIIPT